MSDITTLLIAYKDLFWIIFTLAATIISILTYFNVRKSIKQSLYDNILKIQLEAYEVLLQELKEDTGEYLFSLDLENMMKFNLISHLVNKGVLQNIELFDNIYNIYMMMNEGKNGKDFSVEELSQDLEAINEITVLIGEDFVGEEVVKEKESWKEKVKKKLVRDNYLTSTGLRGAVRGGESAGVKFALFGFTAKAWRNENPELAKNNNVRDFASINELTILSNLETHNAQMIREGRSKTERFHITQ